MFPLNQTFNPAQNQSRFTQRSGLLQIHFKLRHPIVNFVRVHQHLLHAPGAFVFGRNDVGVAQIAGGGVEASIRPVTPSLEDVFIARLARKEQAA